MTLSFPRVYRKKRVQGGFYSLTWGCFSQHLLKLSWGLQDGGSEINLATVGKGGVGGRGLKEIHAKASSFT
jgi:hypothetical protein